MRPIPSFATLALLAHFAASAACSRPEDPEPAQDAGKAADAALAQDAAASPDAGSSADASAQKDAGSAPDAGSARDAGGPVVISGSVTTTTATGTTPLSGATVEILGASPAITTTTAGDGTYSLTVAHGTYFVRASKAGMISAQVGVVTSRSTVVAELSMLSTLSASLLASQVHVNLDTGKGIVVVGFETSDTGGGYSATLSANAGSCFALPASGWPPETRNTTLSGGQSANALFFINVPTDTTTATFVPPSGHSCAEKLPIGNYRVDANVMTGITAVCN